MTDGEATTWLEEHRAQLELIVLTARLRGDGVRTPGTGYARLALQVHRSMINRAHDGVSALRMFENWSSGPPT